MSDQRKRSIPPEAIPAARELRRRMMPAERCLWESLRNRRLAGLKFRRQHTIGPYIVDFCCPAKHLVIEIDGGIHKQQRGYDAARSEYLESRGYLVLRISNDDVLSDIDLVQRRILDAIQE